MNTVVLNLNPITHLTDEQFYQLCLANRDLSLEMNAAGELIIVPRSTYVQQGFAQTPPAGA